MRITSAMILGCAIIFSPSARACILDDVPIYPLEHRLLLDPIVFIGRVAAVGRLGSNEPSNKPSHGLPKNVMIEVIFDVVSPIRGNLVSGQHFTIIVPPPIRSSCGLYTTPNYVVGHTWLYAGAAGHSPNRGVSLEGKLDPEIQAVVDKINRGIPLSSDPAAIAKIDEELRKDQTDMDAVSED